MRKLFKNTMWQSGVQAKSAIGIEYSSKGLSAVSVSHVDSQQYSVDWMEIDPSSDVSQLPKLLKTWLADHKATGAPANLVLNPEFYQLFLVELPNVPEEELKEAIQWRVKDLINYPLDDAVVDVFPLPEDAFRGRMKMAYAIAARLDNIKHIINAASEAKLNLQTIDVTEMATRNVINAWSQSNQAIAVLHVGGKGAQINIMEGNNVYLSRNLNIKKSDLVNAEGADSKREFLQLEIQRSLDYFESQIGKGSVSQILFTPLENHYQTTINELNNVINAKVSLLDLRDRFQFPGEVDISEQRVLFNALGAALRGYVSHDAAG